MKRPSHNKSDSASIFVGQSWTAEKKATALASYRGSKTALKRMREALFEKRESLREQDEATHPASEVNWSLKKAENLAQRKLLTRLMNELSMLEEMNGDKAEG